MRHRKINAMSLVVMVASLLRLVDMLDDVLRSLAPSGHVRSFGLSFAQHVVSSPSKPGSDERYRRPTPPDRTGTTHARPPTCRRSPPVPAEDVPARGPTPPGRVQSHC